MNVGSLFAGIGGFDLGLERAGMRTAWQVELDPFCRAVLARHFPDAEQYPDVRRIKSRELFRTHGFGQPVGPVDVLCGGFPCQDISLAGAGAGLAGARSGLWSEYARIVGELRPRYVIVENVSALLGRGLGTVLSDLAALGYDAEWDCLPASAFGAPHQRDRIWIVAYPQCDELRQQPVGVGGRGGSSVASVDGAPRTMADAQGARLEGTGVRGRPACGGPMGHADSAPSDAYASAGPSRRAACEPGWWSAEPDVGRVADGVPARVDRLRALGNALVPQIAEWIGRRIMNYGRERTAA